MRRLVQGLDDAYTDYVDRIIRVLTKNWYVQRSNGLALYFPTFEQIKTFKMKEKERKNKALANRQVHCEYVLGKSSHL